MKKTFFALLLAVLACTIVMADDVIKVLSVYHNGMRTTIPLAGIDSLDHSMYDADSILHSEYTSTIVHALDRDYQIPIASIDSFVLDEIDVEKFKAQRKEIENFINEQTDLEVNAFQTNLLAWLNANENIREATMNEAKDFIIVKFKNGLESFVIFQDMSFFDSEPLEENAYSRRVSYKKYYDVSKQEGERIINTPNIMYIQGLDMKLLSISTTQLFNEYEVLQNQLYYSPIDSGGLKCWDKSLAFINEDFSRYNFIIVSQTHGTSIIVEDANNKGHSMLGGFLVEDDKQVLNTSGINDELKKTLRTLGMLVYVDNKGLILQKSKNVFLISPHFMAQKLKNNSNSMVYGSYCWSFYIAAHTYIPTLVGYHNRSHAFVNTWALERFTEKMFNGYTFAQSMKEVQEYVNEKLLNEFYDSWLDSNAPNSKERYFSISIDDIKVTDERGYPIITGCINGYNNLKKRELKDAFRLYVHKGNKTFTPDNNEIVIKDSIKVEDNGKLTCIISNKLEPGTYSFIIGFEYAGNVFYGDVKQGEVGINLCPDNNHPHAIDLGLPSGTKWCCCNVGAKSPEEYGRYYAWGETTEKPIYDWDSYKWHKESEWDYEEFTKYNKYDNKKVLDDEDDAAMANMVGNNWCMPSVKQQEELIRNCYVKFTKINGVYGLLITGKNENLLFLPAAGYHRRDELKDVGCGGYYWSSSLWPYYDWHAYYMYFYNSGYMEIDYYDRLEGYSVRGVSK